MAVSPFSKFFTLGAILAVALVRPPAFADSESMPVRTLKQIVDQQKTLLDEAAKQGDKLDEESLREQLQSLCHEYDLLLHDSPNFADAYVSYGLLLRKIDMRREAMAMLLKANQLDPDIPLVKNELGNFLAEDGKPLEAVNYFFSAIKLEPKEPLYHYELGKLLYEARDDFLKSGIYTREKLDDAMLEAFRRAAELAPDRLEFTYRYAESFYDLAKPDWDGALKVWASLEDKAQSPLEQQTMRLHAANVLIKDGRIDPARFLLSTVTESTLTVQKQKLVAQLPENAKK